ncbi:acyl carrier protein [Phaeobacter sp. B1627]|uniref:acyl carrier protein n=1 Tax=Phaeobacter sp. B1627 TaxID=2583809 RepID=UPI001119F871|nr:acyl carrier protein [Phaeobacter sp. B1627]TNJ42313.1 acyl carrier protein [Phaeobacter sp. B1627]
MTKIRSRILGVLQRHNVDGLVFEETRPLSDNGFDSYSFIEMTVHIEQAFGMEFDDASLDLNRYATLGDFLSFTESLVSDAIAQRPAE